MMLFLIIGLVITTGGAVGKTSLRASFIAGALLLVSAAAQAAGLGKLTVLTHLGEPLRAEIDVVAVEKGELDTLNARLASPDAYVQSNLPYPSPSLGLRLSVEQRAERRAVHPRHQSRSRCLSRSSICWWN